MPSKFTSKDTPIIGLNKYLGTLWSSQVETCYPIYIVRPVQLTDTVSIDILT